MNLSCCLQQDERHLYHLFKIFKERRAEEFMEKKGFEWKLQLLTVAHFGGAHESLVRSTKLLTD